MRQSLHVDGARLEGITRTPFPASKKHYEPGRRFPELRVPFRDVALTDTRHADGRVTPKRPARPPRPDGPDPRPRAHDRPKEGRPSAGQDLDPPPRKRRAAPALE